MAEFDEEAELNDQLKEVYDQFDPDGDGITIEELEQAMISWGQSPTQKELEEMMAKADSDGSGVIDFTEFVNLMKRQMKDAETNNELEVAFSVFDRDGSGSISRAELSYIMLHCGGPQKLSELELEQMMAIVDVVHSYL